MNIYEKLQKCRVDLQNSGLKKTGQNKFSGYDYFELEDFLPKVNELFYVNKLCGIITFDKETAKLTIVDAEKPDSSITFTSPMSEASLKGCHPIQNLGAIETYQRRYLYMMALEIVESDPLDGATSKEVEKQKESDKSTAKATKEQIDHITALVKEKGMEGPAFWDYLKRMENEGKISSQYAYNKDKSIRWTVEDIKALEADLELPF